MKNPVETPDQPASGSAPAPVVHHKHGIDLSTIVTVGAVVLVIVMIVIHL